jgi:tetratricopeptide (TPR) repeat protein
MYLDATGQATKFVNKYLGLSCYKKKDYSMAFHYLSEAYKQDDQDPETTYFLANACRYSGREEEGVILLEKTVGLMMPDSADLRNVYIDLAELNNVLHRYNRAISYYQGAYALNPDDYLVFLFVAQIYDNGLKDYNNALSFYEGFLRYSREANKDSEDDPRIQAIYEYVEGRINSIREEQFFEQE